MLKYISLMNNCLLQKKSYLKKKPNKTLILQLPIIVGDLHGHIFVLLKGQAVVI